jgi:DNA-binding beta-propeller fold protein YncE
MTKTNLLAGRTGGSLRALAGGSLAALLLAGCGGGGAAGGASGSTHELVLVSNGFAELLPHKTYRIETLNSPSGPQVVAIRSEQDLLDNVVVGNPVHAVPVYPEETILPSGAPGNHFIYARFSRPILFGSVLSSSPGLLENNSMTGSIVVSSIEPQTGESKVIRGQVFINGETYGSTPVGSPAALPRERWVAADGSALDFNDDGEVNSDDPGFGFPGSEGTFVGQSLLISPDTVVFVVDSDSNLSTHEAFPTGVQIRMDIKTSVRDELGKPLAHSALASTTVGIDTVRPEVLSSPPPTSTPLITPGGGELDVDPLTTITVEFSEPLQPDAVGDLLSVAVPNLSSAIGVTFGQAPSIVDVPFHVRPVSVYDLSRWELLPAFNFPGSGPTVGDCGIFSRVDVAVRAGNLIDLTGNPSQLPSSTFFLTGEGPGIVNVPVTPDAVYLGRSGGQPGISVVDLNGFGQGTGNPTYDPADPIEEGNTNYPNNLNVKLQGTLMRPPLSAGTCTIDGGSQGVFTLALDSSLQDRVVRAPVVQSVGDMMLGYSLDVAFNNAPAPFGCQGQGGNLCAADGFKQVATIIDGSTLSPATLNPNGTIVLIDGGPNIVGWGPHPNPPPLIYPPLCVSPYIGGQEPTSIDTPAGNLLVPGDAFGNPALGIPPSGLLSLQGNVFFQGPSLPATNVNACSLYGLRQQAGQFMYVIDRARNEILVLNSNRMTVIDRIVVPDPTSLAIGTNVDFLVVSSQSTDSVTFIDIDPASSSFHQIVKTVAVGNAPRGIAWEPGNEDIFVCNEGGNSISIISAFSLSVRKIVTSSLDRPFEVAMTPRQAGFGHLRNVYFAYILGRNGRVSVFESGPNSVNGWGYDDIIGAIPMEYRNPKTILADPLDLRSAFWVVHEGPLNAGTQLLDGSPTEGALTKIVAETAFPGVLPLNFQSLLIPQFRDISYAVVVSIGEERLTGVPVDLAFDNMRNLGGIVNWVTNFSAGSPVPLNGKSIVRQAGAPLPTNQPRFLFAAVPSPTLGLGGVDVILLDGAFLRFDTNVFEPGIQSIDAMGTVSLMDYFRQ